jgi:hypothetical protein
MGFERVDWLTLVDVGQDTALGDCDVAEELVQFLIVADGELEMARDDTGLLVVTSSVASQFENFGSKVLENSSEVDWSTSTNTLSVVALSEQTVNTTDWESETGLR